MNARILNLVQVSLLAATAALFAGCKNKDPPRKPLRPSGGGAIASAEKNSFTEVTAKLDKGGNFYLYLSTEQALNKLSQAITTLQQCLHPDARPPGHGPRRHRPHL